MRNGNMLKLSIKRDQEWHVKCTSGFCKETSKVKQFNKITLQTFAFWAPKFHRTLVHRGLNIGHNMPYWLLRNWILDLSYGYLRMYLPILYDIGQLRHISPVRILITWFSAQLAHFQQEQRIPSTFVCYIEEIRSLNFDYLNTLQRDKLCPRSFEISSFVSM